MIMLTGAMHSLTNISERCQPPKTPSAEELAKHNLRQIIAGGQDAKERCERLRNLEYREYRKTDKDYNTVGRVFVSLLC